MKPSSILTSLFIGSAVSLFAGQPSKEVVTTTTHSGVISQDVEASYNASAGARMSVSPRRNADVSEQNSHFQYVLSYAVPERPVLRLGVGYDRYDFGFVGPGFIPGALQALNLVAGLDLKISDILIRIEAQPGFYGDDRGFNGGDFNVPVILGASYIVSKDFQWIAGLYFNPNASNPVTGGAGFRWKMSDRWLLNAVPPYFSQTVSVISIPDGEAEVRQRVDQVYVDFLASAESVEEIAFFRKKQARVKVALSTVSEP